MENDTDVHGDILVSRAKADLLMTQAEAVRAGIPGSYGGCRVNPSLDSARGQQPATGDGLPATSWEIASLQRRTLRELQRTRPMVEMMLAMEMAAGHVTAAQILRFVHDADITRAVCCRARAILASQKPTEPQRPRMGLMSRFWNRFLGATGDWRAYKTRRINWLEAMGDWRRRMERCLMPHRPAPAAVKELKAGPYAGTDHAPPPEPPRPAATDAGPPLVRLGPGGDFLQDGQG